MKIVKYLICLLVFNFLTPLLLDIFAQNDNWTLPPTSVVTKKAFPKLVNYAHRYDLLVSGNNNSTLYLEERLAQWNVIILHPDQKISFDKIRNTNRGIKILVWIPLQGPAITDSLYTGFKNSWNCKDIYGNQIMAPWNQPIANPFADNKAYVYHILQFLKSRYQKYDGVMLDCLWEYPYSSADINGDGKSDNSDIDSLRIANTFLMSEIHKAYPNWIITGNGGKPWASGSSYFNYANGCLNENALGNEFNDPSWDYLWTTYKYSVNESEIPVYNFICVDVRKDRTIDQAQSLRVLTADDKRRFRLGLVTSMLLDNGYFGFDKGDVLHGQLWWFKEYEVDLGKPSSSYKMNIYGNNLVSREFEKGTIIVNPTKGSTQISFNSTYIDASTNVQSSKFILPANDARIFIKKPFPFIVLHNQLDSSITKKAELFPGFPNPFNSTTTLRFSLYQESNVKLSIYNSLGEEVETLLDSKLAAGIHTINWNADKYPSGVYIVRINCGNFVQSNKVILMK